MKITKKYLQRVIKEEVSFLFEEGEQTPGDAAMEKDSEGKYKDFGDREDTRVGSTTALARDQKASTILGRIKTEFDSLESLEEQITWIFEYLLYNDANEIVAWHRAGAGAPEDED